MLKAFTFWLPQRHVRSDCVCCVQSKAGLGTVPTKSRNSDTRNDPNSAISGIGIHIPIPSVPNPAIAIFRSDPENSRKLSSQSHPVPNPGIIILIRSRKFQKFSSRSHLARILDGVFLSRSWKKFPESYIPIPSRPEPRIQYFWSRTRKFAKVVIPIPSHTKFQDGYIILEGEREREREREKERS